MTSPSALPLPVGQVFDIAFPGFTPRITIRSARELTVEIIHGDDAGFTDTVSYEAVAMRENQVMLSWQEHIGSVIVHVLDLGSCTAHTVVAPARGGLMRLTGQIDLKSPSGAETNDRLFTSGVDTSQSG